MSQFDILDEKAREIIQSRILKGMIGPGSDTWGVEDKEEIISDYPLQRYFSGIVFPDKTICKTIDEKENADSESEASIESKETNEEVIEKQKEEETKLSGIANPNDDEIKISQNNFFPTNVGLSVALQKDVKTIDVTFSFGLYYQPKQSEIKIKINQAGYDSFFEEGIPIPLAWRDILKYEEGYMFLERDLKGEQSKPERENGEYGQFDKFKHFSNLKRQTEEGGFFSAYYYINYLEKLVSRVWKRKDFQITEKIAIENTSKPIILNLGDDIYKDTKVGFNIKVYPASNSNYVKVQIVNLSEKHPSNRFSNKSEPLNKKCLFQTEISIKSTGITEYKDHTLSTYYPEAELEDKEAEEIEFIYRNVKSYAVGHNCSAKWNENHSVIQTTFLPEQNIKDVINEFDDNSLDDCLDIKNLSNWGLPKETIISNLKRFVKSYKEWIEKQETEVNKLNRAESEIANRLVDRQKENFNRLNSNVDLLNDDKVFRAFQIANTAMLIQLIVSNDKRLGKVEKEISEFDTELNFDNLEFFSRERGFESPTSHLFKTVNTSQFLEFVIRLHFSCKKSIFQFLYSYICNQFTKLRQKMIINFSVQNFGSIKDKQTLSFEADKSTHLEDAYIINLGGQRILKLALIYGANASGKTTILKALDFLRDIVLEPERKKTNELDFNPFLFDSKTPKQNSIISIEFFQNEIKYFYEVEFFKKAIVNEELYFYNPNKANFFKRKTNLSNQFTEITFGNKISTDKVFEKTLEANTLWNNTVLGGYLKTNIDLKELQEVVDWFENYLSPLVYTRTELEGFVTSKIDDKEISKSDVVTILKKADFNISDIIIQEEEKDIPDDFIEFLKKQVKAPSDKIKELEEKGKLTAVNIEFEHTVNNAKYSLPLEFESQGTRRYYGFAGLLALLIKNSTAFPIDELEASLHPDLYLHFILSFLMNSKTSQIIATTHNREILDNKDIFRNDAIWFTDKQESCSTELYSLTDFDSSVVRNTTNILNAYKSGKLSGTPNLGDTFIDLNL